MKKLNKRYEKSLKSVKAQKVCPCSGNACIGCQLEPVPTAQSQYNKLYPMHRSGQYKLY